MPSSPLSPTGPAPPGPPTGPAPPWGPRGPVSPVSPEHATAQERAPRQRKGTRMDARMTMSFEERAAPRSHRERENADERRPKSEWTWALVFDAPPSRRPIAVPHVRRTSGPAPGLRTRGDLPATASQPFLGPVLRGGFRSSHRCGAVPVSHRIPSRRFRSCVGPPGPTVSVSAT